MKATEADMDRDFVPFDTYSFGVTETAPEPRESKNLAGAAGVSGTTLPASARLLPDYLEGDLSEALRHGTGDDDLKRLLTQSIHTPNTPRIQTIQLTELSPLDPTGSYHFELPAAEDPLPNPQPSVEIQKNGDRVEKISINCTCGEVIDLNCVY